MHMLTLTCLKVFTCIASIMHVKFEVHMHDKIVSHVWKDFTCNKMHGKKVHTYDKNFSHVLQNFTPISKSSHACEMLMWWTCIFSNIDFTWFLFFTHFSHPFHTIFTHIALVVDVVGKEINYVYINWWNVLEFIISFCKDSIQAWNKPALSSFRDFTLICYYTEHHVIFIWDLNSRITQVPRIAAQKSS